MLFGARRRRGSTQSRSSAASDVYKKQAFNQGSAPEHVEMRFRMHAQNVVFCRHGCRRSVQVYTLQRAKNGVHPRDLFRVAGRGDVIKTIGMSHQGCVHTATKPKPPTTETTLHLARHNPTAGVLHTQCA